MPRWVKDDDGRDYAAVKLRFEMSRTDYAVIRAYIRDNPDEEWSVAQALTNALKIGLEELAEDYAPTRRS